MPYHVLAYLEESYRKYPDCIALADAVKGVGIPTVEVHISAVDQRESYRQISYIREVALTCISGKGFAGYLEAMDILKKHIESQHEH